jgi:hypothetical protein
MREEQLMPAYVEGFLRKAHGAAPEKLTTSKNFEAMMYREIANKLDNSYYDYRTEMRSQLRAAIDMLITKTPHISLKNKLLAKKEGIGPLQNAKEVQSWIDEVIELIEPDED